MSPDYLWDTMDIQALKVEIQQVLASTSDTDLLGKLRRHLEMLSGTRSELINSGSILKEPEPIPVLRAEVKRLVDEVRDTQVLSSVLAFLRGDQEELLWRSVLGARAERAEADFAAGRVYTQEQVEAHFKAKRAR
jgi:hypothetical protein